MFCIVYKLKFSHATFSFLKGLVALHALLTLLRSVAGSSASADPFLVPSNSFDVLGKGRKDSLAKSIHEFEFSEADFVKHDYFHSHASLKQRTLKRRRTTLSKIFLNRFKRKSKTSQLTQNIHLQENEQSSLLKVLQKKRTKSLVFPRPSRLLRKMLLNVRKFFLLSMKRILHWLRKIQFIVRGQKTFWPQNELLKRRPTEKETEEFAPENPERLISFVKKQVEQCKGLENRALATGLELNDAEIKRWLLAADWNTEIDDKPLVVLIEQAVRWREIFKPNKISAQAVYDTLQTGCIYVNGQSRDGSPLLYYRPASTKTFNNFDKLFVFTVERAISSMSKNADQFIVVVDLKGMKLRHIPPGPILRSTTDALNNYPGRPKKIFVMNCGSTSGIAWRLIKPFLSKRITDMVFVASSKKKIRSVLRYVSADRLEEAVGGTNSKQVSLSFIKS